MKNIRQFFLISVSLIYSSVLIAGMSLEEHCNLSGLGELASFVKCLNTDVALVAVIEEVSPQVGTNNNPPNLRIKVVEVLKGKISPGVYRSKWSQLVNFSDTGTREEFRKMGLEKVSGPSKGSKWIFLGKISEKDPKFFEISGSPKRIPYSRENLQQVKLGIGKR